MILETTSVNHKNNQFSQFGTVPGPDSKRVILGAFVASWVL